MSVPDARDVLGSRWRPVLEQAIEAAIAPPVKRNRYARDARVPWRVIEELRGALTAAGIDWQAVKAQQDARDAEALAALDDAP